MSALNLIPNPQVVLLQTGLFLANTFILKKLILDPYLELKEKRLGVTKSREAELKSESLKIVEQQQNIKDKIQDAVVQANQMRVSRKSEAQHQFEKLVRKAKDEAQAAATEEKKQIEAQYKEQEAQLENYADKLTEQFIKVLS